jgi:hypothetical protein
MFLGIGVGHRSGYDVANPPQQPTGADPETWGDDEPNDGPEDLAIVDLAHARNDGTQDRRDTRISHSLFLVHVVLPVYESSVV